MKKRILGIERALMFLCKQARKYWRYYSPVYKEVRASLFCIECRKKVKYIEVDHNPALGARPRVIEDFPDWWNRLMLGPQFGLCKVHHTEKTKRERKKKTKELK